MIFKEWLRYRGLAERSVENYDHAISSSLSKWAIEGGLTDGPITSIQGYKRFNSIALAIRNLEVFKENDRRGHGMYGSALNKYADYLQEGFDGDIEEDIDSILSKEAVSVTEKSNLLKTRIGQGGFRQRLLNYWGACAVTGYRDPALLVASHIKPWRASSSPERLDHFNGLLLLPTLDKVFDAGFVSFEPTGEIMISPLLEEPERIGVSQGMGVPLEESHQPYMHFHRENVFHT